MLGWVTSVADQQPLHQETPIVFLALYWSGPHPVGLADLLFIFDHLNRATLTREELESHLSTLVSAGLVEERPHQTYAIPSTVYSRFDDFRRRRRRNRFDDAELFVRRHAIDHPVANVVRIPENAFNRAVELHREKFARAAPPRRR